MLKSGKFGAANSDWSFAPTREIDAAIDREVLNVGVAAGDGDIEIWAGATFHIWNTSHGPVFASQKKDVLRAFLGKKLSTQTSNKRSAYFGKSFEPGELPLDKPRIAFRTITRALDTRTSIACLLPPGVAMTNGPVLVRRNATAADEAVILAVLCSIPFDWYARRFVEMNFTFELLDQFPIPSKKGNKTLRMRLQSVSGRLAAFDDRYANWAQEVGVPVGSVKTETEKSELIYEIDALVSLMYGLSECQVVHIFETFHRGWDYKPRLERVLEYYAKWRGQADA
jgi:hypothetical protein